MTIARGTLRLDPQVIADAIGERTERAPNGCLLWTRSLCKGYGQMWVEGKRYYAHRLAWFAHTGELLEPATQILHDCDNPPCCEPSHLFTGTPATNMADMRAKERHRHGVAAGSANTNAKLTEDDVREIRRRKATGEIAKSIARDFAVRPNTVHRICRREAWAHVG